MQGLLTYYEGDSWLHRRNPVIKLMALFVIVLVAMLAFDLWTPLILFVLVLLAETVLGRVSARAYAGVLALLFVLSALGFVGANGFFYQPREGQTLTVLWQAGRLRLSVEGLRVGVALTLRTLAIAMCSVVLVTTTDPTDLVLSLIQQGRFPVRLGYGVLVAFRFLPLWQTELATIRAAHRIRGVGERPSLAGRWEQLRRYAVPLLAGAIRKAERISVAMDSKAFGALPHRTYYRRVPVTWRDWLMLAGTVALVAAVLWALNLAGLLAGFGAVPSV